MRNITFDGRLGKDAEVLSAKNGRQYVRFNVANNLYVSGNERTDWFDVVCYDPFIVEKRAQYLKKGSYVIITGQIISEVNRGNGNIYLNHHVTASTVEMPRLGRREETDASQDNGNEPLVSVYTGKTASEKTYAPREISTQPAPAYAPSAYSGGVDFSNSNDDDLPF